MINDQLTPEEQEILKSVENITHLLHQFVSRNHDCPIR